MTTLPPPDPGPGWSSPAASVPSAQPVATVSRPTERRAGIVPLRPLAVGEILDGAFTLIRTQPRVVLGLASAYAALTTVLELVLQLGFSAYPTTTSDSSSSFNDSLAAFDTAGLSSIALRWIAHAVLTGVLAVVISEAVLGRTMTAREALARVRSRIFGLIGVAVVVTFLECLGFVGFGIGAVFLWTLLASTVPAYVLEGQSLRGALARSRDLVLGAWWRFFGVRSLGVGIAAVAELVLQVPFFIAGIAIQEAISGSTITGVPWPLLITVAVGGFVARTVGAPISSAVTVLLYIDRRMRYEALDIGLARSASA
jgi:hypothetical protein